MKIVGGGDEHLSSPFFILHTIILYNRYMKMDKIYNIKYVDAWSSYDPDLYADEYYTYRKDSRNKIVAPLFFDAYGFVERHGDDIVIAFIKKKGVSLKETIDKNEKLVDGLVIPETSLASKARSCSHGALKGKVVGMRVAVTWRDPTYIKGLPEYDCSVLYTEGALYKIEKDSIILRDTETIRIHPMPVKNHPAGKPLWYTIPVSLIKDIEVVSKEL